MAIHAETKGKKINQQNIKKLALKTMRHSSAAMNIMKLAPKIAQTSIGFVRNNMTMKSELIQLHDCLWWTEFSPQLFCPPPPKKKHPKGISSSTTGAMPQWYLLRSHSIFGLEERATCRGGARRGGWTAIQTPVLPPLNFLIRGGAIAAGRRRTAVGVRGRRRRDLRACGCARERGERRGAAARFAGVRAIWERRG